MSVLRRHLPALLLAAAGSDAAAAEGRHWRLRLPTPPFHEPVLHPFNAELLRLALERHGDHLTLLRSAPLTWSRQVRELQLGRVDVAPLPAVDAAYDGYGLRRVNFPLRPGLLGLRLLLVRKDRVAELSRIKSLAALRGALRLGYGQDWADRELMQRLGFRLELARSTEALFQMLISGRCDWLSRGVSEVDEELQRYGKLSAELAVLPDVALHYPLDDCFYVAPQQQALQLALGDGLQRARRDGSWVRLLAQHYGTQLRRHGLAQRQIWSLIGYPAPAGLDPELLDAGRWLPQLLAAA